MEHFKALLLGILVTLIVFTAFYVMVQVSVLPTIEGTGDMIKDTATKAGVTITPASPTP